MITIEIFGPGCRRCQATQQAVEEALATLPVAVSVVRIRDPREMARNRIMFTPAVRVNGQVKCSGRVPTTDEVRGWLVEAGNPAA